LFLFYTISNAYTYGNSIVEVLMKPGAMSSWVILVGLISVNASAELSLPDAKKVVADYQTLREACSDTTGAKRLECMARLSSASDGYRQAKAVVAASTASNNPKIVKAH
jgi:hypothetical protein